MTPLMKLFLCTILMILFVLFAEQSGITPQQPLFWQAVGISVTAVSLILFVFPEPEEEE